MRISVEKNDSPITIIASLIQKLGSLCKCLILTPKYHQYKVNY